MKRRKGTPPVNVAHSVKTRLLQRARQEDEDFNSLLIRYVIERLLYRLAASEYVHDFVLKGAVLFVIWSDRPHRATKDLDLLGSGPPDTNRLTAIFREVCRVSVPDDGVTFLADTVVAEPIREDAVYDGIRLRFMAQLGTAEVPVQVDVGFGDSTIPEPHEVELPVLLDFPRPKLKVYARESAIAEKLHALVELGLANSRMKDFYDLWFLAMRTSFDGRVLSEAVLATFARRRTQVPRTMPTGLSDLFATDPTKLEQWAAFVRRARLRAEAPTLGQAVTTVRAFLWPVLDTGTGTEPSHLETTWPPGGPWESRRRGSSGLS